MLCADWGVMKAGICIMYIPLAMAKVPTLYHFYGMILLGCHRSAKGEFNLATPKLRDYIGSLSRSLALDFHLFSLWHHAPVSSFHTIPPLSPSLLPLFFSFYFDSAHVIHSSISMVLSQGFNRGSMDSVVRIHKQIVFHSPLRKPRGSNCGPHVWGSGRQ